MNIDAIRNLQWNSLAMKVAAVGLVGALAACGGGSGGGASSPKPNDDSAVVPGAEGETDFTSLGIAVTPSGTSNGNLGATIDSSMKITFSNLQGDGVYPYHFTFDSGLPGGNLSSIFSGGVYTFAIGSINKVISISAPRATQAVQNVFWRNLDDPYVFGIGEAGYLLHPNTRIWPTSGTATYSGKALQYFLNAQHPTEDNPVAQEGFALLTSTVTATVDFSAKTISLVINSDAADSAITENSNLINAALNQFGFTYQFSNIDFSGDVLDFTRDPSNLETIGFFGANAENLAGTLVYNTWNKPADLPGQTWEYVGFALTKQP